MNAFKWFCTLLGACYLLTFSNKYASQTDAYLQEKR